MDLRLVVCYGFNRLIIKFYQFLTNIYGMDKRRVIVVAVYLYNMLHEGLVQCECIVSVSYCYICILGLVCVIHILLGG